MENRIRQLRKQHGMTLKQLGAQLGLAESTISQYETGKRNPDNETLLKLGELFQVSIDEILGRTTLSEDKKRAPAKGKELPQGAYREVLADEGVRILLDADASLTDDQLDEIVEFIKVKRRKENR